MGNNVPKDGKPGTTDQWPRWEGPPKTDHADLPAKDDPATAPRKPWRYVQN